MAKTPAVPEPSEALVRLRGIFAQNKASDTDDPEVAQMKMVERIFAGDTLDDILGGGDAVHADDVLGVPFRFEDAEFREADEKSVPEVAKKHGVSAQTIYAWRKHFGSLEPTDVKRLRQLEQENGRLKKMVADRDLEIDVLKEITRKKW